MKFCKKCNGLMKHSSDDGHMECINCSYRERDEGHLVSKERIQKLPERKKGIVEDGNIFADFDFKCKRCGYDKAEVIERQPYISDEDSLTFLKCGKCGFAERLARKTG